MPRKKLERMIGAAEEFLSVMFVARAAFVLRSVGRIIDRRDKNGFGTGFLVAPNVLMTNEHVLDSAARAGAASVQFQYELDMGLRELRGHEFRLDPDRLFLRRPRPRLRPRGGRRPLGGQGPGQAGRAGEVRLPAARWSRGQDPCRSAGEHHPAPRRRAKADRVPREHAQAAAEGKGFDNVAHYTGDTKPGSSGSPVFSDAWEVIALHHSGVPDTDERGRWLDVNGNPWDSGDRPKMERQVGRQRGHPGLPAGQDGSSSTMPRRPARRGS